MNESYRREERAEQEHGEHVRDPRAAQADPRAGKDATGTVGTPGSRLGVLTGGLRLEARTLMLARCAAESSPSRCS